MEKASDPMPMLRALEAGDERRSLTVAVQIWKETGSLAAYLAVFSALDSNDDEVRHLAEQSLNRNSPRPCDRRKETRDA